MTCYKVCESCALVTCYIYYTIIILYLSKNFKASGGNINIYRTEADLI